jgi:hypothetical protein
MAFEFMTYRVFQLKIGFNLQSNRAVMTALENGLPAGRTATLRPKRSTAALKSRRGNAPCEETVDALIEKLSAEGAKKPAKKPRLA